MSKKNRPSNQQRIANLKASANLNRRDFLYGLGSSLGALAFSSMISADQAFARATSGGPLAPKAPMLPAKAKACIFLMMEGGPSHIDTFDPKPKLSKYHLKEFQQGGENLSAMSSGKRYYVESPFQTRKVGQSGADMSEHFVHLAEVADDLCFYRGAQAESVNHPTAMYHINTGNKFGGDPGLGGWVTYGLGTLNENLPAFIVLPEVAYPQGGAGNWTNGFLPAYYQGTPLRSVGSPILDIEPPPGVSRYHQRESLDLLAELNQKHQQEHPAHEELKARMENYELAFRMQMEIPDIIDIEKEDEKTKEMYGVGEETTDAFGRKCLLARRLVEQGVRFVQVYSGGWDSHDYLARAHGKLIQSIDKPIAALIKDLKRRGMLEETLIVWCGEFGRSPDNGVRGGGVAYGRDHNPNAMAMWMAGGGVKAGHTIGATDEIGSSAVEVVHPLKDVHVTLLRLMGLDDNKLTYFHGGRYKQLSQTGGNVIKELLA
ncbi:hypothetical protein OKW21_005092 [Catalinimonas alkaloidigena]|uniref:DUF1501 domain-containing protein n=1 Tax=Catalinimonas alkaloidigena TaxID=1075417 RepID=UPI0024075A71|nr:DUF1501 domain-containing protein [Catalinimonas alkaloidigena]MDF9799829.1 hypothetical protein [Catalinimonas alkaloidigena]